MVSLRRSNMVWLSYANQGAYGRVGKQEGFVLDRVLTLVDRQIPVS